LAAALKEVRNVVLHVSKEFLALPKAFNILLCFLDVDLLPLAL
jgi:hypothetical protein